MVPIRKRLLNLAICLDQLGFNIITLGSSDPDETMSAAAWRLEQRNKRAGKLFRPFIDTLFLVLFNDKDHCANAYLSEKNNKHLPADYSN